MGKSLLYFHFQRNTASNEHYCTTPPENVQSTAQRTRTHNMYIMRCSFISRLTELRKPLAQIPPVDDANYNERHWKNFPQHSRKCFKKVGGPYRHPRKNKGVWAIKHFNEFGL